MRLLLLLILVGCASREEEIKNRKAEIYYSQGTAGLVSGDYTTALESLQKAVALLPKESRVHNNLGMAFYFKDRPETAINHLNEAIKLDPKNLEAKNNLAGVYLNLGRKKNAKRIYHELLNQLTFRHQAQVHYNLAEIAKQSGDRRLAERHYRSSIKANKTYCGSHFQLGQMLFERKQFSDALEHLRLGSQGQCSRSPRTHYYEGLGYLKVKQFGAAAAKLEYVANKYPNGKYGKKAKRLRSQIERDNKLNHTKKR